MQYFFFNLEKKPKKRTEYFKLLFNYLASIDHQFLSGIRDSMKAGSLWVMMRGVGVVRKSIHLSWFAKQLGLGLQCWGFKRVQEEIRSEEASTLQIRSVALPPGQCTSPQLQPCHRCLSNMGIKTVPKPPNSPHIAHCDFSYYLSSEDVFMRQLRRWKRLWRRSVIRLHMGPPKSCWNGTKSALHPEEITSMRIRVSCVSYQ